MPAGATRCPVQPMQEGRPTPCSTSSACAGRAAAARAAWPGAGAGAGRGAPATAAPGRPAAAGHMRRRPPARPVPAKKILRLGSGVPERMHLRARSLHSNSERPVRQRGMCAKPAGEALLLKTWPSQGQERHRRPAPIRSAPAVRHQQAAAQAIFKTQSPALPAARVLRRRAGPPPPRCAAALPAGRPRRARQPHAPSRRHPRHPRAQGGRLRAHTLLAPCRMRNMCD
jgi:hypothetical protein